MTTFKNLPFGSSDVFVIKFIIYQPERNSQFLSKPWVI